MLSCKSLSVAYGDIVALTDISIEVKRGEAVALIGANGAGKTTLLQTISGLNRPRGGDVIFEERALGKTSTEQRVRLGIAHAPEVEVPNHRNFNCSDLGVLSPGPDEPLTRKMLGIDTEPEQTG